MNKFTPEQEERLKNFTDEQKEVLENSLNYFYHMSQGINCITGSKMDAFMDIVENKPFNEDQMLMIAKGIDKNLSNEQINMYANLEFNTKQMGIIEAGLLEGLSMELVSIYAKPEFNAGQMYQISDGLKHGLSAEQINVFANPEFSIEQMHAIKDGFNEGLSIDQINVFAKPEFNKSQMDIICRGLTDGLSADQINVFAKPEFTSSQMCSIKEGFSYGLSADQINIYAKPEFDDKKMEMIKTGMKNGLSINDVRDIANPDLSLEQMDEMVYDKVKSFAKGYIVYESYIEQGYYGVDTFLSKNVAKVCNSEKDALETIKNCRQNDNESKCSFAVINQNGYVCCERTEANIEKMLAAKTTEQQIILAPSYDIAKNIKAEATVEAEYGDECLEGTMATLAHHGPRSNNPAPCNTPDVPVLPPFATVVVSHIDLDTLGGIYALQGRKPEDDRFWEAAEKIDVEGAHHIHELDQDIQDKLNAYYAYNDGQPRQRYTEAIDVTKQIDDTYKIVNAIIDINDPEHDELIAAGKEWAQTREKEVEDQLVYENRDVRVFDTNGIFCAASYFSPNQNTICPATVTYNEKFKSITLAFEDGGKQLNAREIVQELWGPEAGGREGIAGSPRNVEMTKDDLAKLVNELTERQLKLETEIMPHQYEGNQMLSSLSIPDNIEKIGEGAFKNCSNLSEILVTNELLAKTDIASAFEGTNLDMEGMEKIVDDFMQTHEGRGMELDANDKIEDEPLANIEDEKVDPLELNDKIEDEDTADDFSDL